MKKQVLFLAAAAFLVCGNIHAQSTSIEGSDMESWHTVASTPDISLEAPDGWYGADSLVSGLAPVAKLAGIIITPKKQLFKSTDSHAGDFAAELKTEGLGDTVGNMAGILSNAQISLDMAAAMAGNGSMLDYIVFGSGTAITGKVDTVSAWVKTSSGNTDQSAITIRVMQDTTQVGSGYYAISSSDTTYTEVHVPITYTEENVTPDNIIVLFQSSDMTSSTKTEGNSLKVDDASYTYATTGIKQPLFSEDKLLVYPNPADGVIHFNLNAKEDAAQYTLTVVDMNGRILSQQALTSQINSINVSQWAAGNYFYSLTNVKGHKVENGKFTVK